MSDPLINPNLPYQEKNPVQPPYPQPYGQGQYYYAQQKTNIIAILSIALVWVSSLAGIILGHIALSQIKTSGEKGRGLAIAGLAIGYTGTIFIGLLFIIDFAIIFANPNN